jgi:hypothetical protein
MAFVASLTIVQVPQGPYADRADVMISVARVGKLLRLAILGIVTPTPVRFPPPRSRPAPVPSSLTPRASARTCLGALARGGPFCSCRAYRESAHSFRQFSSSIFPLTVFHDRADFAASWIWASEFSSCVASWIWASEFSSFVASWIRASEFLSSDRHLDHIVCPRWSRRETGGPARSNRQVVQEQVPFSVEPSREDNEDEFLEIFRPVRGSARQSSWKVAAGGRQHRCETTLVFQSRMHVHCS